MIIKQSIKIRSFGDIKYENAYIVSNTKIKDNKLAILNYK